MRPLTAALALLADGGDFELRGVAAHARAADRRPGRRAARARLPHRLPRQRRATRRCASRPARGPLALDAPIRVRGDVSSQFLTALLLALPLVAPSADIVIEVDGELISKPYIEITLNLLAALRHRRRSATAGSASPSPPGSRYRSPGRDPRRGRRLVGSLLHRARRHRPRSTAPLRIEGVGSDSIQGDIRFVDAARPMGAHVDARRRLARGARAAPGR